MFHSCRSRGARSVADDQSKLSLIARPLAPLAVGLTMIFAAVFFGCGGAGSRSGPAGGETPLFSDRAAEVGLDFVHFNGMTGEYYAPEVFGSGAALLDYDNDGDLDVFLLQGAFLENGKTREEAIFPPAEGLSLVDRLFRNELVETSKLGFTDVTDESGLRATGYGMGVAVGDYDRDGWLDLYVTNVGPNQLWHNNGDGTFSDVTSGAGVDDPRWSVPALFFDYDRDGWLDLFVGNYVDFNLGTHRVCSTDTGAIDYCGPRSFRPEPNRLFRNRGDGTFVDTTALSLPNRQSGTTLGAISADLNGDGWLDLYVANDWMPNRMWINQGDGTFHNKALLGGTALSGDGLAEAGMGVAAADFDHDGDEDLLLTHLVGETNTVYRNEGNAQFVDVSVPTRLGMPSWSATGFGTAWLDFDNDGALDVLVVNGAVRKLESSPQVRGPYPLAQPNQLYKNLRDGRFEEVSEQTGHFGSAFEISRGAAFGDVDNDGDVDAVIANNCGPARLYLNNVGQERHWLGLRLISGSPPHDALGSEVLVELVDGTVIRRRTRTDGSYASASDPRVLIGLGDQQQVLEARVEWLGREVESFGRLEVDRYHMLEAGKGKVVR